MALIVKDDEAKRLAHELAALTGESLAEAVTMRRAFVGTLIESRLVAEVRKEPRAGS